MEGCKLPELSPSNTGNSSREGASTKTGIETPVFTLFSSVERGLTSGFWGIPFPGRQQKKYIK